MSHAGFFHAGERAGAVEGVAAAVVAVAAVVELVVAGSAWAEGTMATAVMRLQGRLAFFILTKELNLFFIVSKLPGKFSIVSPTLIPD